MSRAGSTTASACRFSWSRSRLPKRRRARSETARRSSSCSRRSATDASGEWWQGSQPQPWSGWASRAASSIRSGLQVVPVAGAALAYGLAVWMHGSGFIAAFVGGAVFGGLRREVGGEVSFFLEEAGGLLGAVTFILFGAVMLVPTLDDLTVEIVLYALLSLTLVRMVPVALAMLGSGARRPTVAFLGWFGPRGLASIVFAVILVEDADLANESVLLNTIFLTIGLSVLLHGLTATPLAARYAAWFAAHPRDAMPGFESAPAPVQRPHGWAARLLHRHRDVDDASSEPAS